MGSTSPTRLKKGAQVDVVWNGKTTHLPGPNVTEHPWHKLPPDLRDPNGKGASR